MAEKPLEMWTLSERPRDFPNGWVVRRWRILPGLLVPDPDGYGFTCCMGCARKWLRLKGLVVQARKPSDDPCIVETWV